MDDDERRLVEANEEILRLVDLQDTDRADEEEDLEERLESLRDEVRRLEGDLGDRVIGLRGYRGGPG